MEIREKIRALRKQKGLRAADIAEKVGISRSFYTLLENGKRRLTTEYLERISKALRVSPGEIYDWAPHMRRHEPDLARNSQTHIREVNVQALRETLQPFFDDQTDAVVECIHTFVVARNRRKRAAEQPKERGVQDENALLGGHDR